MNYIATTASPPPTGTVGICRCFRTPPPTRFDSGPGDRAALLPEHDFGDQPKRGTALHSSQGRRRREGVDRFSQASDARAAPPGLPDPGRSSLTSSQGGERVRGESRGSAESVLSTAVLTMTNWYGTT